MLFDQSRLQSSSLYFDNTLTTILYFKLSQVAPRVICHTKLHIFVSFFGRVTFLDVFVCAVFSSELFFSFLNFFSIINIRTPFTDSRHGDFRLLS